MKKCKTCNIEKEEEAFVKHSSTKDRRSNECKICSVARTQRWRAANPEKVRATNYKRRYGISLEQYEELLKEQQGRCAICELPETGRTTGPNARRLSVDHCHNSLAVRGLLCQKCNAAIGLVGDSVDVLKAAIKYLEQ